MPERVSLDEFDIYRDVRQRAWKADAYRKGRSTYASVMKMLGMYESVSEDVMQDVAEGEARRTEAYHVRESEQGKHKDRSGSGVGVRVLFYGGVTLLEVITERFVPNPLEIGAPEIVEVELPNQKTAIGLILPEGTFQVQDEFSTYRRVKLFESAVSLENGWVEPVGRYEQFMPHDVLGITDSGGALWIN